MAETLNSSKFAYCANGETVVEFDSRSVNDRRGNDPDRFLGQMAQAGLFDDAPGDRDLMTLALASRLTGVIVTPQMLTGRSLWGELINEPPASPPAAETILQNRDPQSASAIRCATPARRAQALAYYLDALATDAGAERESAIVEAVRAVERGGAGHLSSVRPDLERLFTTWRTEAADLPKLHEIDRRRNRRTFARIRRSSARGVLRNALQQAVLSEDPVATAYIVLQDLDRYARPDRHAEVMRLLGDG